MDRRSAIGESPKTATVEAVRARQVKHPVGLARRTPFRRVGPPTLVFNSARPSAFRFRNHGQLVRERARNRLFVMLAILAAFAGLIIATALMYMKP